VTAITVKSASPSVFVVRDHRRDRQCGGCAADRHCAARQQREAPLPPEETRGDEAGRDRQRHEKDDDRHALHADLDDLLEADPQAEQPDSEAQHEFGREIDARSADGVSSKKIEGDAEQKGKQHHRRPVMAAQESSSRPDRAAQQHTGEDASQDGRCRRNREGHGPISARGFVIPRKREARRQRICCGSQSAACGNAIIMAISKTSAPMNGRQPMMTSPTVTLPLLMPWIT
jgi:hypothetical protein